MPPAPLCGPGGFCFFRGRARYSRGEIGLGEARNTLKDFLKAEGYDPHKAGLKNLASTARLNLVMRQNAAMANAAAEWKRMHDPDAMKIFPYVRYHARKDSRSRDGHKELDGKIFHKDDPFLKTHTPPWEFNCRCWLEEITAKEAGREPEKVQKPTPPEDVTIDSASGFSFDPEHAFEEFDFSAIKNPVLREQAEIGVEKFVGTLHQPGAKDVGGEHFKTLGINMQDGKPYPKDAEHAKIKKAVDAISKGENSFIQVITKDKKREFAGIYDPDGKPRWVGMGPRNGHAVEFPDIPDGCTVIHNHPGGEAFSVWDVESFIRCNMKKMVASVRPADGKIGKYVLTRKETGDILTEAEIKKRYDFAIAKTKNAFDAWKEAFNGTCYEITYIG